MTALNTFNEEEQGLKRGAPRGQKRPFRPREVWAIRARLEMLGEIRNLALLNLAIELHVALWEKTVTDNDGPTQRAKRTK